jgi:hypothetical protein
LVLVGISIAAVTLGIGAVIIMELLKHTR